MEDLEQLSKPELIRLVTDLQARLVRCNLAAGLRVLARISLGISIVLIPFRYRYITIPRPIPPIYQDYTDVLLFASEVFVIATLVFWILSLMFEPRRISFGPLFLSLPILGLTGMGFFSIIFSVDPTLSFYNAIRLVILGGFGLYIVNEIKSLGEIILPLTLMIFIQVAVEIGQILQQHSLGLLALGELNLDPAWSGVSIVSAGGVRSLRAYGLSDHPNILGGILAIGLILIAAWYMHSESKWNTPIASLFALGSVGLMLTFSRSAWLAMVVGMLLMAGLLMAIRFKHDIINLAALAGAGLIFVLPFVWHDANLIGVRLNRQNSFTQVPTENRSIDERLALVDAGNQIFDTHALTGVGLGAFPIALHQIFPHFPYDYQAVHIVLLEVANETGILGALFFLIAMVAPWLALWINRKQIQFTPSLIGTTAALAAITLIGFFDHYTWDISSGRMIQWLVWGLWGGIYISSLTGEQND